MEIISDNILSHLLKNYRLGIIELNNCKVVKSNNAINRLICTTVEEIRHNYILSEINKIPAIESTRQAYKLIGNDPNRYRPSADSLIRRIVKGNTLYSISNIVDILNLISIKSGYSIGGYDSDKISGNVIFSIGKKEDEYCGIGRGQLNIENLPTLKDDIGAFGTPTSDSERTKITLDSINIAFIFFDFGLHDFLISILNYTSELIGNVCNNQNIKINIIENLH
jgi:DNA/RNA-binding domain of Phe-tRNA-synthetase-like protein